MIRPIPSPEVLREVMQADFTVSDQQWAAISSPLEPAVVIAGAGSGKTSLMAARVVYLVVTGQVTPEQVLGLTFTTKAARELGTRIRTALDKAGFGTARPVDDEEEVLEPTVATYNAYAAALLTDHGLLIGHEPDTRVMADASRYQLAARAIARHPGRIDLLSDHPGTVINYILGLEGALSEHLCPVDEVRDFHRRERPRFEEALAGSRGRKELEDVLNAIDRREELLGLVETYRRLKAEHGVMDFSDQIALAAQLAQEQPDVGRAQRASYRVVLLDEYQDTSVAQARMLSALFSGAEGRGHAVTAVGDPNQAIYGWRGASVSNILGFGLDFPRADGSPDVPIHELTVNRRSDRLILEVANDLAAPLYAALPTVGALQPGTSEEGRVRAAVFESYAGELAWLADQVHAARAGGTSWREIGVLTRDNATAADVFDALTSREIPVEIVGLQGLVRLPEVAEVVATLTLLHDLTANAELLTLLGGPRWAIGPRDLKLLGDRAAELALRAPRRELTSLAEQLEGAVAGSDPTEVPALLDALDDPGSLPYSAEARERFALLSSELRHLRGHAGEPILDLVRRIIDVTGIDVELASAVSPAARARRDNLDLFVKAVAEFQAVDGEVSLGALLAYLTAEDEMGTGLDVATPTEADSVKLLTVHRAKGLEWDAVFCVGVGEGKFPSGTTRTKWTKGPGVLPNALRGDAPDLPVLAGHTTADLTSFALAAKEHEAEEELRLGYVAWTRARHELVVSAYWWTESRKTRVGPSAFLRQLIEHPSVVADPVCPDPAPEATNPLLAVPVTAPWPVTSHTSEALLRRAAAEAVEAVRGLLVPDPPLTEDEAERVAGWDAELETLLAEARRDRSSVVDVPLPSSLSATALARLRDDPEVFAGQLARPMPRQPSPAARFGTRFHAWVEARFGQQLLFGTDELGDRADAGIDDDTDLRALIDAFAAGEFGDRTPHAIEPSFALVLDGQVVRGRIDAVYAEPGPDGQPGYLLVDWKTNRQQDADPLQLAIYRVAWAELAGVPIDRVRAAFYYVRSGTLVAYDDLPDRTALEVLVRQ